MANFFRIIGAVGIVAGLALIAVMLRPLLDGQPMAFLGSPLLTQAAMVFSAGIIALGFGQLIAINQRVAETLESLHTYVSSPDGDEAETSATVPARDAFANIPDYSPRRDPRVVKEGTYRDYTVLTLEDGTVAIQTTSGWKRFRGLREFERLLTA